MLSAMKAARAAVDRARDVRLISVMKRTAPSQFCL
jgi:hypothetical protein